MKQISIPKTSRLEPIKTTLQKGFTLVEVLIALMIAALMISVATIALNDNEAAELKTKSRQLYGLLQVAQEESIIRGIELGVRIESDGYSFMIYNGGKWQPLEDHRLLKDIQLEEPVRIAVNLEGQDALLENEAPEDDGDSERGSKGGSATSENEEDKNKAKTPQIYMLSSGEMNEFVVTIGLDRDEPIFYRIRGNYVGEIDFSNALEGHYSHDWDKDLEDDDE
ncbi:type II secretion system minor pseudopilin GspH [Kangiella taiwanensis]|uniref:Type II secretion system protein H n=1 Tax=Kangiella taiwanensis TaxID=1079179 RepID=A0ABP8HUY9_9GAMM|nr:type II secretion system minor pseudopilin GspH [Kangiella taiwanensis]